MAGAPWQRPYGRVHRNESPRGACHVAPAEGPRAPPEDGVPGPCAGQRGAGGGIPEVKGEAVRQTVWGSIVEAKTNIAVGFGINYVANMTILPLFGFDSLTPGKNFVIGLLYTGISLVRQFVIRRWFNGLKWGHK